MAFSQFSGIKSSSRDERENSRSPFREWQTSGTKFQGAECQSEDYYQKPEDHPAYPREWGMFWERRYQELIDEGKDPDKYDFKREWIPFWKIRSRELFEAEVNPKRALFI